MNTITLQALASFPDQLEAHFHAFPPALAHWAPDDWEGIPSERLTAIEQVCHVRDIEIDGYHVRFQRTLAETNPGLESIDTDALARERAYGRDDATKALTSFRHARARTLDLIGGLGDAQLARNAVFEGYGPLTMRSLVHYLCSHDQQHHAGLQWLLGRIAAQPR